MLEKEYVQVVIVAAFVFGYGILMREETKCSLYQWSGRWSVFAAALTLAGFGYHATQECNHLIATRMIQPANGISEPKASETEYRVTMSTGTQIHWRKFNVGANTTTTNLDGPVSNLQGRSGSIGDRSDSRSAIICRPGGSLDCVRGGALWPDATDGASPDAGEAF